jgi:putative transposase
MGLQAIYPKKHLSESGGNQRIYLYLLAGMSIDHPNQVWCADIAYVRMARGFLYLVAIMDWFSRYVLSWLLSDRLGSYFRFYNRLRFHQALDYATPEEVYQGRRVGC